MIYLWPMTKNSENNTVLERLGFEQFNEMQELAQETILNSSNTLLLSPTGSGKTVAFLLPLLNLIQADIHQVQVLILVPSRELAIQIEQVWKKMGTSFKVNTSYGGHSMDVEMKNLSQPPAILIGTPGRIVDHLKRKSFETNQIKTLILDEFDKSLQLGFHEEMAFICNQLSKINKRICVSATPALEIPSFTGITSPEILDFIPDTTEDSNLSVQLVLSKEKDKLNCLVQLLCSINSEAALIFCNHREAAERICELLLQKNIQATYYHGGMDQEERERALILFRNGSVNYLVTTDLAARGLDIPEMKHVIHDHLPSKKEEFIHRNGRTARMLATGTAYVLHHQDDKKVDYIDYQMKTFSVKKEMELPKPPQFQTLYVSGGKKTKLRKMDLVGFFMQSGNLAKEDIGLIEVKDFSSFIAIKSKAINKLLIQIENQKMKGKKYKIEVARAVIKKTE